jgi:hypothetical protein
VPGGATASSLPAGLTSDWGLIRCVKIGAN